MPLRLTLAVTTRRAEKVDETLGKFQKLQIAPMLGPRNRKLWGHQLDPYLQSMRTIRYTLANL